MAEAFAGVLREANQLLDNSTGQRVDAPLVSGRLIRVPADLMAAERLLNSRVQGLEIPFELAGSRSSPEDRAFIQSLPGGRQQAALQLVGRLIAAPELAQPGDYAALEEYVGPSAAQRITALAIASSGLNGAEVSRRTDESLHTLADGDTFSDLGELYLLDGALGGALFQALNPEFDPLALPVGAQVRVPPLSAVASFWALRGIGPLLQIDPISGAITGLNVPPHITDVVIK